MEVDGAVSLSNENMSMIIYIHVKIGVKVSVKGRKKEFQATLQTAASRAPVATAFNLFIILDILTGKPGVIQKCSKGR